jgi:general secretion pathway protein G
VAVPVYTDYADRARVGQAIADLGSLDLRIERYVADTFRPPGTLADLPGTIPVDPWGRAYRYLRIEGEAPTILSKVRKDGKMIPVNGDYDLYSVGPDGKTVPPLVANDSYDDVVRAGNGGFIGVAADF